MKKKDQHALLKRRIDQEIRSVFWAAMEEEERKDEQGTWLISRVLYVWVK